MVELGSKKEYHLKMYCKECKREWKGEMCWACDEEPVAKRFKVEHLDDEQPIPMDIDGVNRNLLKEFNKVAGTPVKTPRVTPRAPTKRKRPFIRGTLYSRENLWCNPLPFLMYHSPL